ncbi:MAG: hypothetical protein JXA60_04100 [Candidatus Coatesbacteria bacterium]|nr:hypothetical protein [Candidatus Coatesbacteria bacterium]
MKKKLIVDLVIISAVLILIEFTCFLTQDRLEEDNGLGNDGKFYYQMASSLSELHRPVSQKPFIYRPAIPAIVGLSVKSGLTSDLLKTFLLANTLFSVLSVFVLYLLLKSFSLKRIWLIAITSIYALNYLSPIRMTWCNPTHIDSGSMFFIILLFWIMNLKGSRIFIYFSIISFIAVFFRGLDIALVSIVYYLQKRESFTRSIVPFLSSISAYIVMQFLVIPSGEFSIIKVMIHWALVKPLLGTVLSLFTAYGTVLFIILFDHGFSRKFLKDNKGYLFFIVICFLSSWIGGNASARLFYFSLPVVLVMIAKSLNDNRLKLKTPALILIGITQLLSMRVFFTIPVRNQITQRLFLPDIQKSIDEKFILTIFTPLSNDIAYLDLSPLHAQPNIIIQYLLSYLIFGLFFYYFFIRNQGTLHNMTD